jgi:predicted helicase
VRFKVVWQVLNALRSHDERFDAMINSIALNAGSVQDLQLMTDHVGPTREDDDEVVSDKKAAQLALFSLEQWQEAVYTRIVDKVGTRVYWDQWAADVADIATAQITRINTILESPDTDNKVIKQFDKGLETGRWLSSHEAFINSEAGQAATSKVTGMELVAAPGTWASFVGRARSTCGGMNGFGIK